jgi:hypothetical protein
MPTDPQEKDEIQPFMPSEPFVPTDVLERSANTERRILGMTAAQRFVIMLLVFILTVIIGSLLLVASGKIVF